MPLADELPDAVRPPREDDGDIRQPGPFAEAGGIEAAPDAGPSEEAAAFWAARPDGWAAKWRDTDAGHVVFGSR